MRDYEILSVRVWGGNKTQKRDEDGWMMMSLTLKGHTSEPVDYKSKTVPEVGSFIHGDIVDYVSNAGNRRTRLETAEYKKKENLKQDTITAQWALSQALMYTPDHKDLDSVVEYAKALIIKVKEITGE